MKIIAPNDCDNSPKRRVVKDLLINLYTGNYDNFLENVNESFIYQRINKPAINNKKDLKELLKKQSRPTTITINQILSHGKFGACNGYLDDSIGITHFAYFFEFKSAGSNLIKTMTLYQV
ncbi:hypothetical protein [Pedobacter sp. Leaf132]|uniref:hypothetical protein n=1 Tax=Pedobacter sp. Leaf132 TaxID=2876557 RepID=UPI001E337D9A|nr:hypothetical protein [Pedobacter sp. Leaf132]